MKSLLRAAFTTFATLWLAVTLAFFLLRMLPGDAIEMQLRQSGVGDTIIQDRRMQQGLDRPILAQYGSYLVNALRGDLGYSLVDGQPVLQIVLQQFAPTLLLAVFSLIVGSVLGILLGLVASLGSQPVLVSSARFLTDLSLSTPIYWTGTLAIFIFTVELGLLPSAGAGRVSHLILPVAVLGFHASGNVARVVFTRVRQVSSADHVRFARAKGLRERTVISQHILRVALLPVVTSILIQLGFLLNGAVMTESLFVRPGLGRLLLERTLQQDYPVIQGIVLLGAFIYSLLGFLAHTLYVFFDPRVAQ